MTTTHVMVDAPFWLETRLCSTNISAILVSCFEGHANWRTKSNRMKVKCTLKCLNTVQKDRKLITLVHDSHFSSNKYQHLSLVIRFFSTSLPLLEIKKKMNWKYKWVEPQKSSFPLKAVKLVFTFAFCIVLNIYIEIVVLSTGYYFSLSIINYPHLQFFNYITVTCTAIVSWKAVDFACIFSWYPRKRNRKSEKSNIQRLLGVRKE